ncbi:uncharacterized protein FFM5_15336 [Fusarium fujikuroi]|nr:uncharacterized protein FFM5_15336 [Fusarium fujikuroi]
MPLYAYNISAVTCLYLAILYLNTYKDVPIKDNPIPDILVTFAGITSVSYPGQSTPAYRQGTAKPPRTPK